MNFLNFFSPFLRIVIEKKGIISIILQFGLKAFCASGRNLSITKYSNRKSYAKKRFYQKNFLINR